MKLHRARWGAIAIAVLLGMPRLGADAAAPETGLGTGAYSVEFWNEARGLPQSRTRAVVQTRDGYLWLGTDGGLVRFDGVSFTLFNRRTGSLRDDEVLILKEDRDGALWIGTAGGGLTVLKDGRFTTYTKADGLPDDLIRSIDVDPAGNIWIATGGGVARWSNGRLAAFTVKDGLAHNLVIRVCASSSAGVFAVAANKVHRLAGDRFTVVEGWVAAGDGRVSNLTAGAGGALWLTFENGLIKRMRGGEVTAYRPGANGLALFATVFEDAQGDVWLASSNGLLRLDGDAFRLVLPAAVNHRLGAVYYVCRDREGNLWLGLEASGLAQLRPSKFAMLTAEQGMPSDSTRVVFQDSRDDIWIGTTIGLVRWSHGSLTSFGHADGLPATSVSAVGEDRDGVVWVAAGGDLFKFRDGRLTRDPDWQHVFDIKTIYRDRQHRMWIGSDGDGLFRFEGGRKTVFRVKDGLPSDQVRGILLDRGGALWVATVGSGVCRYADGKFTTFTTRDGLASDRVTVVYEDDQGAIWCGTRGGLSRFADGRFTTFTTRDGLIADFVSGMLDDGAGAFWFSCANGLFTVPKADFRDFAAGRLPALRAQVFGVRDGLASPAFGAGLQPNAWRTTDGRLLFCSLKGLVVVGSGHDIQNTVVPPVHIESVTIDKRRHPPGPAVTVPPGDGEVEIHYTALSFVAPEKVQFKYRLEGFDRDWVEAGSRRFAYFANLRSGSYRFRVIACNEDGLWNETGAAFAFTLTPHFYQRLWFYTLCLVALVGLIGAVYELRLNQLKARARELKRRVEEEMDKVKVLSGLLPICSSCKKVRDDKGYWNQIEVYVHQHSEAEFSHGICPDCLKKLYPEYCDEVPGNDSGTTRTEGQVPDR